MSQDEFKTIEVMKIKKKTNPKIAVEPTSVDQDTQELIHLELEKAQMLRDQMVRDAESAAEQLISQARLDVEQLKSQASSEMDAWWEQRRQEDQEIVEQSRHNGYQTGFDEGTIAATQQVHDNYTGLIVEAQNILEQSNEMYRKTILDAEIFLLELSCGIAEKIITKKLDQAEDWVIDMVKQAILRSSEKGSIAICVAPAQFTYIQSVREELSYIVDPQAELHIYPDASIKDSGCVIKTSFGTIDARVETQLTEIKQALLDIARRGDESVEP